jgi:DNA invertase Pin-like site-specific DNA recombinase
MKKRGTTARRNGTVRCAVYTRKSSEEGLEQEFNSLQAQREACEAFINSQRHEGWVCLRTAYDDGGFSGATMDRPALQRLLADLTAGRVDTVVVYKIDRLTRSLADFAKIVEILDAKGASFVSVTQQFNTTTSMGRLTLNVLLSFAQFEREVIGERIRDKIAASKRKRDVDGRRAAARLSGARPQARHRRQRGGNRALDFSPLCRTRLCPVVDGRPAAPSTRL